ncbi:hypothetical protein [Sphingomonas sp.]|uniref:hypothetical protein n=1 Tax=Sphingomonas sp. TaxID=28214 RepID=UPI002ED7C111
MTDFLKRCAFRVAIILLVPYVLLTWFLALPYVVIDWQARRDHFEDFHATFVSRRSWESWWGCLRDGRA